MTTLGEELLVVSLSPVVGRNTRVHGGVRAALCAAPILDQWVGGTAMPPENELRRYVRKHNHGTLEPALAWLVGAGKVTTSGRFFRYDWLADVAHGTAIRERLVNSLTGQSAPARHDAALAVLLYCASLWDWAFNTTPERPWVMGRKGGWPGPLAARAAMLSSGAMNPDGATASDLPSVARVLVREYRDHGD